MAAADGADGRDGECRELLMGTWLAIALVADTLIGDDQCLRDELTEQLEAAELLSRDHGSRHLALAGTLTFLERLHRARQPARCASRPAAKAGSPAAG